MANWLTNRVIIEGKDTKKLLKFLDNKVDFQKIIPMPKELEGTKAPSDNPNSPENKALRKKYGAANWYEWALQNWGCKWTAQNAIHWRNNEIDDELPMVSANELLFDTPNNIPFGIYEKLSQMFPACKFTVIVSEEGDEIRQVITYIGNNYRINQLTKLPNVK